MLPRVFVIYRPTPDGQAAARFAASVARPYGELRVLLPVAPLPVADLPGLAKEVVGWTGEAPSTYGWAHAPVESFFHAGDPETFDFGDAVVVDGALRRRDVTVLRPQFERGLFSRGDGPAMLPFGDRESGLRAAAVGLPMLARMGFTEVVFYHTTWRDASVESVRPEDHMSANARSQLAGLRSSAEGRGLAVRERVETADEISSGVRAAATALGCRLVVMARGLTRRGTGLVDMVANDFAVPVLAIGRPKGAS